MAQESSTPAAPAAGEHREIRYRATFDPADEVTLLGTVTDGLADVLGTDSKTLDPPLSSVAAWEALEQLVERHLGDDPAPIHYVQFEYLGFVVAAHGDGEVTITDAEE